MNESNAPMPAEAEHIPGPEAQAEGADVSPRHDEDDRLKPTFVLAVREAVEEVLGEIDVLQLDIPTDAEYAAIRSALESIGRPIGSNDLLIAAHARATGATIVTANTREFKRVRGLKVENWLA